MNCKKGGKSKQSIDPFFFCCPVIIKLFSKNGNPLKNVKEIKYIYFTLFPLVQLFMNISFSKMYGGRGCEFHFQGICQKKKCPR